MPVGESWGRVALDAPLPGLFLPLSLTGPFTWGNRGNAEGTQIALLANRPGVACEPCQGGDSTIGGEEP
jgi:hypothetical protein